MKYQFSEQPLKLLMSHLLGLDPMTHDSLLSLSLYIYYTCIYIPYIYIYYTHIYKYVNTVISFENRPMFDHIHNGQRGKPGFSEELLVVSQFTLFATFKTLSRRGWWRYGKGVHGKYVNDSMILWNLTVSSWYSWFFAINATIECIFESIILWETLKMHNAWKTTNLEQLNTANFPLGGMFSTVGCFHHQAFDLYTYQILKALHTASIDEYLHFGYLERLLISSDFSVACCTW